MMQGFYNPPGDDFSGPGMVGIALLVLMANIRIAQAEAPPPKDPPIQERNPCIEYLSKDKPKVQETGGPCSPGGETTKAPKLTYRRQSLEDQDPTSISGNPGADNILTGTGWLGQQLGLAEDSGVRLGGLWVGNADIQMSGRLSGSASFNSLGIIDLLLDMKTLAGIHGGTFSATFLQFDGQPSNGRAGVLTGYNGLTGVAPLNRSELYEMWWRQTLFDEHLIVRVGKSVPTFDFNNVSRRLPIPDEKPFVAAVSGLLFTPIFVNPSVLGVLPGYYNSAWGMTVTATPSAHGYLSYGIYDGSLARGRQTGTHAWPTFDSYYFNIGEAGISWDGRYPGKAAVGGWGQSGWMGASPHRESGAQGVFATATNRLLNLNVEEGTTGVLLGYVQYGINNSKTMLANQYVGFGVTGINLLPSRPKDSMGLGLGVSWLNNPPRGGETEILTQMYYQAHVVGDIFFQPTFTYVPNPGKPTNDGGQYPAATSMIFQIVTLF
ncbi:porin [Methylomagnum ishizawai]|uniref:Porin n=2 Tax=Methylomagnum ishizawai TaxID=1760988 RepID=A0A1Y6CU54_9GAMM|nr:porin [Methylomagnum ishizawai]